MTTPRHGTRAATCVQHVLRQGLTIAVVAAGLVPATGVLALDVESHSPSQGSPYPRASAAGVRASATVPTAPVAAEVTEVSLTTPAGGTRPLVGDSVQAATTTAVTSSPQDVELFGTVGVTWQHGEQIEDDAIALQVRTRDDGSWSEWVDLEYHDDHAPDPSSPEAAASRPGTEPLVVGDVDAVQVKARTDADLPDDLTLAVIEPGRAGRTERETADTSTTDAGRGPGAALVSSTTAAQPTIFSRAQWGADESIRGKSSLRYGTINAGFVHHTVNANDYTEAQVPAILRSIYAYHVKSRGWSDVGYNFLVDRFGRIWEGRYGGIDKPVVGAHTLNYNEYSFAMSAIGNFDLTEPSEPMLRAYGALFAWKLGLHGVNPASTSQKVGRSTFKAINGHRDAGSTSCPGKYLYAQLPTIRAMAAGGVKPPTTIPTPDPNGGSTDTSPQGNLLGGPYPDLLLRRASDGRGFVVPTGGLTSLASPKRISRNGAKDKVTVTVTPDITGDTRADLIAVTGKGELRIRPGRSNGRFRSTTRALNATAGHTLVTAAGDLNGDGRNDLVARHRGRLVSFLGTPGGRFTRTVLGKGMGNFVAFIGAGDQTGDRRADLLAVAGRGRLTLLKGKGNGRFGGRRPVTGEWHRYRQLVSGADFNGDGLLDLVAHRKKGAAYLVLSHGDGTFAQPVGPIANLKALRSLAGAVELTGDSFPDLVGVQGNSIVSVANLGSFELGAPVDTGVSFAGADQLVNVGDWNRDGHGDVVAHHGDGTAALHLGDGAGHLSSAVPLAANFAGQTLLAAGDVTADGLPDLLGVTTGGALTLYAGTGGGTQPGAPYAGVAPTRAGLPADVSRFDWVVPVGDIRAAGKGDFVVRDRGTGAVLVYRGGGKARDPRYLGAGLDGYDLAG